jgi:hypothetical protein
MRAARRGFAARTPLPEGHPGIAFRRSVLRTADSSLLPKKNPPGIAGRVFVMFDRGD